MLPNNLLLYCLTICFNRHYVLFYKYAKGEEDEGEEDEGENC